MTSAELKAFIAAQLATPVTQVVKLIDSFNATIDFITAQELDDIPDWTALLTFQTDGTGDGKYCKHPDTNALKRIFETKVDNNIGNEPPTNPAITEDANWEEISASAAAAIPEWTPGVYGLGLVIVYHNHSVNGRGLYVLLEPVRPFTSANIETEITAGQWAQIAGGSVPANLQRVVSKAAHGFVLKNVITLNGTGVHVKVTNPATDKFVGLVTEVVDTNNFRIHTAGYVAGLTGLTAGSIHYGQADGTLSTTATDMPVLFADSTSSGYILASGASGGGTLRFGTAAGTDTYTLTLSPALTAYTAGLAILVKFANANTTNPTLNVNSLGAKVIAIRSGTQVISGQIDADKYYMLVYNGVGFEIGDIPYVPNSTTPKGLWVDTSGRVRALLGSVYTELTRSWVHTGTDDVTELSKWQNESLELIFRVLSDKTSEFGNSGTHQIEVSDGITSGNSFFLVPTNQAQAYQFKDKNSNKILTLKTTTGDPALIVHGLEKNMTSAFNIVVKQAFTTVLTTAGAHTVIASIPAVDGMPIKVKVNYAFAAIGAGRLVSIDSLIAIALNSSGTLAGTVQAGNVIYSGGPASGGFNININDTTDEIEIRFQNESGTGFAFTVWVEYEYIVL